MWKKLLWINIVTIGSVLGLLFSVKSSFRDWNWSLAQPSKIPRIVHLSWKSRYIPQDVVKWVQRWPEVNPEWEIWFWDDLSNGEFVKRRFPELLHVYDNYDRPIYRSDMVRYLWLYEYGGVWADLDIEALRSLEPIRDHYPCIISREHEIHTRKWNVDIMACNAYMMCRRRHPFYRLIIDMLETNQKYTYPITATGPLMLTRMYDAYTNLRNDMKLFDQVDDVHLATVEMFMPRADTRAVDKLNKVCEEGSIREKYKHFCEDIKRPGYLAGPSRLSFVDHHWWHSWLPSANVSKETVDIQTVLPGVIFPREEGKF